MLLNSWNPERGPCRSSSHHQVVVLDLELESILTLALHLASLWPNASCVCAHVVVLRPRQRALDLTHGQRHRTELQRADGCAGEKRSENHMIAGRDPLHAQRSKSCQMWEHDERHADASLATASSPSTTASWACPCRWCLVSRARTVAAEPVCAALLISSVHSRGTGLVSPSLASR